MGIQDRDWLSVSFHKWWIESCAKWFMQKYVIGSTTLSFWKSGILIHDHPPIKSLKYASLINILNIFSQFVAGRIEHILCLHGRRVLKVLPTCIFPLLLLLLYSFTVINTSQSSYLSISSKSPKLKVVLETLNTNVLTIYQIES